MGQHLSERSQATKMSEQPTAMNELVPVARQAGGRHAHVPYHAYRMSPVIYRYRIFMDQFVEFRSTGV